MREWNRYEAPDGWRYEHDSMIAEQPSYTPAEAAQEMYVDLVEGYAAMEQLAKRNREHAEAYAAKSRGLEEMVAKLRRALDTANGFALQNERLRERVATLTAHMVALTDQLSAGRP